MNVLFVSPSFAPAYYYGGPIVSSERLCQSLSALGCEVRVVSTNAAGNGRVLEVDTSRPIERGGILVSYCRRTCGEDISVSFLRRISRAVKWADVVIVNAVYSPHCLVTLFACRVEAKPVLWSPRGSLQGGLPESLVKQLWLRLLSGVMPERISLHLTSEVEQTESSWAFPEVRRDVIANGVTVPPQPVSGRQGGRLRLVYVGRLHAIKGLRLLFEAMAINRREGRAPVELVLIGEGTPSHSNELAAAAAKLELNELIEFTGAIHDAESRIKILDNCDAGVLVSERENFGNAVAEIMAAGLPVVVTDNLPWTEVAKRGCGFVVRRSAEDLAAVLGNLRREDLRPMGARARAWMAEEFSWDTRGAEIMASLQRLCK